jgi:hypothetical protein
MSDSRITILTKYWCEEAYVEKYKVQGMWSGKEAKLLQRLLAWVDASFTELESVDRVKEGMLRYLKDESPYLVDNMHDFSLFASSPMKWVKHEIKQVKAVVVPDCFQCKNAGIIVWKNLAYRCRCARGDEYPKFIFAPEDAYKPQDDFDLAVGLLPSPEASLRSLKKFGAPLKKFYPELYKKMGTTLVELLGRERANAIWKEREIQKVDSTIPLPHLREVERSGRGGSADLDSSPRENLRSLGTGLEQHSAVMRQLPSGSGSVADGEEVIT